jgi:hypothetical protein
MLNVHLIDFVTFNTVPFWIITNIANLATAIMFKLSNAELKKRKQVPNALDYMYLALAIIFSFIPVMNIVTAVVMGIGIYKGEGK